MVFFIYKVKSKSFNKILCIIKDKSYFTNDNSSDNNCKITIDKQSNSYYTLKVGNNYLSSTQPPSFSTTNSADSSVYFIFTKTFPEILNVGIFLFLFGTDRMLTSSLDNENLELKKDSKLMENFVVEQKSNNLYSFRSLGSERYLCIVSDKAYFSKTLDEPCKLSLDGSERGYIISSGLYILSARKNVENNSQKSLMQFAFKINEYTKVKSN